MLKIWIRGQHCGELLLGGAKFQGKEEKKKKPSHHSTFTRAGTSSWWLKFSGLRGLWTCRRAPGVHFSSLSHPFRVKIPFPDLTPREGSAPHSCFSLLVFESSLGRFFRAWSGTYLGTIPVFKPPAQDFLHSCSASSLAVKTHRSFPLKSVSCPAVVAEGGFRSQEPALDGTFQF